jgi:hypothetical protein
MVAIASPAVSLVSRNVATGGGTTAAISAIKPSSMTPGPLGILATRPNADAPAATARYASSTDMMQQTFTRGAGIALDSSKLPTRFAAAR